jgi:hypothetical protein
LSAELHSVLIDNLEEATGALGSHINVISTEKAYILELASTSRESVNCPPPSVSTSSSSHTASGLRRPDDAHYQLPECFGFSPLLRPMPDPEVEMPFFLPQLPDETDPAGTGRNDKPDMIDVEAELPFSASIRQTLTTNPRSRHVICGPAWLGSPLRKVSCPFQALSTEDLSSSLDDAITRLLFVLAPPATPMQ